MTNGYEMLNQMDFEEHIKTMDNRELMEFTARQVYTQGNQMAKLPCRQGDCPAGFGRKRTIGICSTIGAIIASAAIGIIEWARKQ